VRQCLQLTVRRILLSVRCVCGAVLRRVQAQSALSTAAALLSPEFGAADIGPDTDGDGDSDAAPAAVPAVCERYGQLSSAIRNAVALSMADAMTGEGMRRMTDRSGYSGGGFRAAAARFLPAGGGALSLCDDSVNGTAANITTGNSTAACDGNQFVVPRRFTGADCDSTRTDTPIPVALCRSPFVCITVCACLPV
jgi:hypothetical protein